MAGVIAILSRALGWYLVPSIDGDFWLINSTIDNERSTTWKIWPGFDCISSWLEATRLFLHTIMQVISIWAHYSNTWYYRVNRPRKVHYPKQTSPSNGYCCIAHKYKVWVVTSPLWRPHQTDRVSLRETAEENRIACSCKPTEKSLDWTNFLFCSDISTNGGSLVESRSYEVF